MPLQPRIALALRCLKLPLKPALTLASQLGATGIQLDARNDVKPGEMSGTGRRHFVHLLEEAGLTVASLDFPLRRTLWESERLDERIDALKQAMELAYQLGAGVVTARLVVLPADDDADGKVLLAHVLEDLARQGNRVGTTLSLGLGRDSAPVLVELLNSVREGPLGVNFDPATSIALGQSPAEALQVVHAHVTHFVVRDAVRDSDGIATEVPVGRGDVPWDELLALLYEMDYRGWLTVDRTQGDDQAGDAGRAIQFLKSVFLG